MPHQAARLVNSGLFFTIDNERTDMAQIAEVNDFLRENCEGDNSPT